MMVYIGTRRILISMFIQIQQTLHLKKYQLLGDNVSVSYDGFFKVDTFTNCKLVLLASTSKMEKEKKSLLIYVEFYNDNGKIAIEEITNNELEIRRDLFLIIKEEMNFPTTIFLELRSHTDDCPLDKFPSLYEDEYY